MKNVFTMINLIKILFENHFHLRYHHQDNKKIENKK